MKKLLIIAGIALFSATASAQSLLHGQPGTNYQNIGGNTYGSDGSTYRSIGNTTYPEYCTGMKKAAENRL